MVNFKDNSFFQGSRGGPTFSRGGGGGGGGGGWVGGGGVQLLIFPIETYKTCDFPGGSRLPVPPPPRSAFASSSFTLEV